MSGLKVLVLGLVAVAAVGLMAWPAHAAFDAYAQLSWPSSDDQMRYMGVPEQRTLPVMGFVQADPAVTSVVVNGEPADLTPSDYQVLGAPQGLPCWGFRVPMILDPGDPIVVDCTDGAGEARQFVYQPNREGCLARLRELRRLQAENYWLQLALANALVWNDDFDDAFPLYNGFIGRYPRLPFGFFFGGLAFSDIDDFFDADDFFRRCFDLDDRFWWAHEERGEYFARRGDWDEAHREFGEVLRRRPELAEAHWRQGETLLAKNQPAEAERELRQAVTRDPKLAPAHSALARSLEVQGRGDQAIAELQKATELKPTSAQANFNMGRLLSSQGKLTEAQAAFEKALQATPRMAVARTGLGTVLAQQGKPDEAIRQFHQAIQANPQLYEARAGLADTYVRQKQYPAAYETIKVGEAYGYKPDGRLMGQIRSQMPIPRAAPRLSVPIVRMPSHYGRK